MLAQGAVSHNHLFGLPDAMRLRLAQGDLDEVLRLADQLDAYGREEPNFWVTHHAAAARSLVGASRWGTTSGMASESESSREELRSEMTRLLAEARDARLRESAQALEAALHLLTRDTPRGSAAVPAGPHDVS